MKKLLIFFILCFSQLFGNVQVGGNFHNIISANQRREQIYLENWSKLTLGYNNFEAGIQLEVHKPPVPHSQDTSGYGLYQRYLEYSGDNYKVTAGNFYTMLGRGLVLRSFENRNIRWDTNLDGFKLDFYHNFIEGKIFTGQPRNLRGDRLPGISGGELTFKISDFLNLGNTYFLTQNDNLLQNGSIYSEITFPFMDLYSEYASRKKGDSPWNTGKAIYLSTDFYIKSWTLRGEFKNYDNYQISNSSLYDYNNPPTVVREHQHTLLNRNQYLINTNNDRGWLFETVFPLQDYGMVTINYNRTNSLSGEKKYEEFFGHLELFEFEKWDWGIAAGKEEKVDAKYLNLVLNSSYNFTLRNTIKFIYEHQHTTITLTKRQFYSQIYKLEYSRAPNFTLSLILERTTDQNSDKNYWVGAQGDINLKGKYDLSIFIGARRQGKTCAGGICTYKPEFEGIETTLKIRF